MNPDGVDNLGDVRLKEWQAGAKLLGATSTHHLGYVDGTLGNNNHVAITGQIEAIVKKTLENRDDVEVEFIGFDLNGLTGHIDHIVASRSACLAFYRLQTKGLPMRRVRLACLTHEDHPDIDTGFVFMQPGRTSDEISETIDAREHLEKVHEIMHCHHTQRDDCDTQITKLGDRVAVDHFLVLE